MIYNGGGKPFFNKISKQDNDLLFDLGIYDEEIKLKQSVLRASMTPDYNLDTCLNEMNMQYGQLINTRNSHLQNAGNVQQIKTFQEIDNFNKQNSDYRKLVNSIKEVFKAFVIRAIVLYKTGNYDANYVKTLMNAVYGFMNTYNEIFVSIKTNVCIVAKIQEKLETREVVQHASALAALDTYTEFPPVPVKKTGVPSRTRGGQNKNLRKKSLLNR